MRLLCHKNNLYSIISKSGFDFFTSFSKVNILLSAKGINPGFWESPFIVYVFPEDVCPYAKTHTYHVRMYEIMHTINTL